MAGDMSKQELDYMQKKQQVRMEILAQDYLAKNIYHQAFRPVEPVNIQVPTNMSDQHKFEIQKRQLAQKKFDESDSRNPTDIVLQNKKERNNTSKRNNKHSESCREQENE